MGGAVEVGDLVEEGPRMAPQEVQVAASNLGLRANPHYVALVAMHPDADQRLSGLIGRVGPGWEAGGWSERKRIMHQGRSI